MAKSKVVQRLRTLMRITLLQCLLAVAFVSGVAAKAAHGQEVLNQRLSFIADRAPLKKVLKDLGRTAHVRFVYSSNLVDTERRITVLADNARLDEVLDKILRPALDYTVEGNFVVLHAAVLPIPTMETLPISAVKRTTLTGRITDEAGEPLVGASVVLEGTTKGAMTDAEGRFSLDIDESERNGTLVVSFVGFEQMRVPLAGRTTVEVTMKENAALQEVIVVGYGTQKKSDITGSVASVSRERLDQLPNNNILQALQGAMPGLQINTNAGGAEGNNQSILIRGRGSITASNSPLIIVDGIPYEGGISELVPTDIESIEILKDASAAAIYGSRGSNGVILVTSKSGKSGQLKVTYDGFYGIQQIANRPDLLSAEEFYQFKRSRLNIPATSMTPSEEAVYQSGKSANWYDLLTQQGSRNQQTLAVSGGSNNAKYYFGGTYLDVQGVAVNDRFRRYSVKSNLDFALTRWLSIGSSTLLSVQDRSGLPGDFAGDLGANYMNPLTTPYNDDGTLTIYAWPEYNLAGNPLSPTLATNKDNSYRIFSSNFAKITVPFIKGLSLRFNGGVELENTNRLTYYGRNTREGFENRGSAETYNAVDRNFTVENILYYNREWNRHTVGFTALYGAQHVDFDRHQLEGVGFPTDALTNYQMAQATLLTPSSANFGRNLLSQMLRLNYGFAGRYLLTVTARRDGYSGFGTDRKYGLFPSLALGWNIARERFMEKADFFTTLKLRLSYGLNGNQAVSAYQSLATFRDRPYISGSVTFPGYVPARLANPNLGWESKRTFNFGLDFGVWNNRIQGTLDAYDANTSDLLLQRTISSVQGFTSIIQNIGKTANRGIELGLNTVNVDRANGLKWTTNANIAYNENKIVDLYGDGRNDLVNRWFIGQPIRVIYDLQYDGVFQTAEEVAASAQPAEKPGYVRIKDQNDDKKIDLTGDRVILGQEDPKYIWGLSNTWHYKGLSLMVFLHGVQGVTKENPLRQDAVFADVRRNTTRKDWWTPTNPSTTHWANDLNANRLNVKVYEDASFARLKDVSLGYDLPTRTLRRLRVDKAKVYLTGRNLATFTKYQGLDPEITNQLTVPLQREFLVGLNVTL